MLVSDFDYQLPSELIAQQPMEPRDHSRLLLLDRNRKVYSDRMFLEMPALLSPGDLLVFNDTKVIPARLFAMKDGGSSRIEVFLLKQLSGSAWECLVRPGKRVKPGVKLHFEQGVTGAVLETTPAGGRVIEFSKDIDFREWLGQVGQTPLPPYITASLANPDRYQTVYAKFEGSVAAPTAGLHFTQGLFGELAKRGIEIGFLTLHVGLGTFRPVQTERIEAHVMHSEFFTISDSLIERIEATKKAGKKVIAVGTTVVRVLESQTDDNGKLRAGSGETNIFIYPGYQFKVVDGLITNFHLPKSTLLMLVSAFAGREFVLESYAHAVTEGYRFFSFGDAMMIL
ncbi:MAG: tRNA preQ1(34) S-adenosylmethionine ribosyltransferase-isomerase QueA [Firmicutes bacterium]|nr:tRNA preQ1(34) S-adenosylmethionine ribosyltransferase-isomerase QueA [Bacillota bacterium]